MNLFLTFKFWRGWVLQSLWLILPYILIMLFFRRDRVDTKKYQIPCIITIVMLNIILELFVYTDTGMGNDFLLKILRYVIPSVLQVGLIFIMGDRYGIPIKRRLFWMCVIPVSFLMAGSIAHAIDYFVGLSFGVYTLFNIQTLFIIRFLVQLVFFFFLRRIYDKQSRQRLTPNNRTLIAFLLLSLYTFVFDFRIWYNQSFVKHYNVDLFNTLEAIGLAVVFVILVYFYIDLELYYNQRELARSEVQTAEEELRYHRQNMEAYATTRRLKHDLNNQYLVVIGLIEDGKEAEALTYLKKSQSELKQEDKFYTPNFTLNYVLNEKFKQANKQGVNLDIHVLLPEMITLENDILAVVLGNLVDNGIAAVARNVDDPEKIVKLVIKTYNNNLIMEIANKFDLKELSTRKTRQWKGLGIRNVKRLVSQAEGIFHQEIKGDEYLSSVIFFDIL